MQDADPRLPLASPVFADLNGLPPRLIQVGTAEILLDDARALATQARAGGVVVTYEEWEDMSHGCQGLAALLPEGAEAIAHAGDFMRAHCR
jgi:monoterpene epsilon-lactone hydrolase